MKKERKLYFTLYTLLLSCLLLSSCSKIDLYEKVSNMPRHEWKSSYKPKFEFAISDTLSPYQLYLIFRHNEKYNYNNLWLNLYVQAPGKKSEKFTLELPLATNEKGWMASGMDDLYEHRIPITLDPEKVNFYKAGNYTFILENIMREEPLQNVMGVGIRMEKKAQ
ncbi:gliding motility lipoprotein GldH [Chitinophagaceae bacterium LB-8]|uniref:Gliding motility lipoprotein GldH n=1 Tax=Paraflavisolibacter caeni TaxID=2982496 RepID=A0A9X2XSE6_9BACT|nr:gliding motility lipoprotein GldH [Paraflavisolibacter caeni]MCU7547815.1 gliding motility lipoprotein GldH [Paraflavisolibacter caeni]